MYSNEIYNKKLQHIFPKTFFTPYKYSKLEIIGMILANIRLKIDRFLLDGNSNKN